MTEQLKETVIDLLVLKATFGLDDNEQAQLDRLIAEAGVSEDESFELTAAAISMVGLPTDEPLPQNLYSKILASGEEFVASLASDALVEAHKSKASEPVEYQKTFSVEPRRSGWNWLGWAVAAAACIALAANVWFTQFAPQEVVKGPVPTVTPAKPTAEQEYAKLIAEPTGVVKANWAPPSPDAKDLKDVSGDVVWSDAKQEGFMRLKGLPINDKSKSTYQLWIFDKTQDAKTPIDGGTFDVDKNGEVIVPIDAKLKALEPALFAITIEKPGGVVVSDRKRMAAVAKVETQSKSNS